MYPFMSNPEANQKANQAFTYWSEGATYTEIANELDVAYDTVDRYIRRAIDHFAKVQDDMPELLPRAITGMFRLLRDVKIELEALAPGHNHRPKLLVIQKDIYKIIIDKSAPHGIGTRTALKETSAKNRDKLRQALNLTNVKQKPER